MKKLYSLFLFVCLLISLSQDAVTQITITASDVATQLAVGNVLTNNADSLTTSANIGAPGSTSWDFSALHSNSTTVLTSVPVGASPFIADFPGSTHALKTSLSGSFGGLGNVTGDLYLYLALGTCLETPGSKGSGTATLPPPFGTQPGTLTITNVPPDTTYALPATLGKTWKTVNTTTTAIILAGLPLTPTVVNHDITYTVDAFGPMTIPGGGTYNALRIRKVENFGSPSVGYVFIAANGASVQFTAADTAQPNNGVIQLQLASITWSGPTATLPIQLSYFNASLDAAASRVMVQWRTVSELNNFGFEVQKAAAPNGNFVTIANGFVPGHGTTNVPQEYASVDQNVSGGAWYYRLKQVDLDGSSTLSDPVRVNVTTGVAAESAPASFHLSQNYPNPFNPSTTFQFSIADRQLTTVRVYDMLGQDVATLVNEVKEPGRYTVRFDATGLSSGVYLYRLQAGSFIETRKLTLLK